MYWYYFQSAREVRVVWKVWVTILQIVQFAVGLGTSPIFPTFVPQFDGKAYEWPGFIYFASYTYFSATYFPSLPTAGSCAAEEFASFAGIAVITSYIVLFLSFYVVTYRKAGSLLGRRKRWGGCLRCLFPLGMDRVGGSDEILHLVWSLR